MLIENSSVVLKEWYLWDNQQMERRHIYIFFGALGLMRFPGIPGGAKASQGGLPIQIIFIIAPCNVNYVDNTFSL